MRMWRIRHGYLLLLVLLQYSTTSLAQNTTTTNAVTTTMTTTVTTTTTTSSAAPAAGYRTVPVNLTVAVGDPAVFSCGVPREIPTLTLTFYRGNSNYSLTCPSGRLEDVTQALYGSCLMANNQSLAVWSIKGTSFSDNGTRVECQQPQNLLKPAAFLHVYDNGVAYYTLIGCVIGGFFGVLLVFGILFIALQRSERFQRCFGGEGAEEDDTTKIVTKDEKKI